MEGQKKQQIEQFYRSTFAEAINHYGENVFFFCGKKMYLKFKNSIILSVELQGTDTAFSQIILMAISKQGILDQNITPFKFIFKESKSSDNGQEKLVSLRVVLSATGEYTVIWPCPLAESDYMALNHLLMTYADLFETFTA